MMRILEVAGCEIVITIDQLIPLGKRSPFEVTNCDPIQNAFLV